MKQLKKRDRPLDILLLSYLDYPSYTGMSKRINGMIHILMDHKISVSILCPLLRNPHQLSNEDYVEYIDLRFLRKLDTEKMFTKMISSLVFSTLAFFRVLKLRPRIVQYQTMYSSIPAVAAKPFVKSKIIGDDILLDCFYGSSIFSRSFFLFLLKFVDVIITPSVKAKKFIEEIYHTKLTVHVSNGITKHSILKKILNQATFVGTFTYSSNRLAAERIAKISNQLEKTFDNFIIKVIGGPLHLLSHEMKESKNVSFLGFVSDEKLEMYLDSSFIGLAPFFNDITGGQRVKCLEYFAHNLLVLSGKAGVSGITGIQEDKHYVLANSETEMAEKLEDILKNPYRYVKIAETGYKYVMANYSWEKVLSVYTRLVKDLVEID